MRIIIGITIDTGSSDYAYVAAIKGFDRQRYFAINIQNVNGNWLSHEN